MIGADLEAARPPAGPAFADAVTFAFGDPATELHGLARLGLSGAGAERAGSALMVLFAGREPVAAVARGGVPVDRDAGFERLALPGLAATVEEPLRRWTLASAGEGHAVALEFEAVGGVAELAAGEAAAQAGGTVGYEQLCRVRGTVRAGGHDHAVRCLGQRGHAWGAPDWERMDAVRTACAWLDDGTGVTLSAVRPSGADHGADAVWAALLQDAGALRVDDPRLSTTYDGEGRQRRAGLELWVGADDAFPRRAAGHAICGAALDLGQLRLDCAVLRWRMDGRAGVGRYDVLRPSEAATSAEREAG